MVKPSKKLKKIFLIVGITGVVYAGFRYLLPLVIPFLAAYIAALGLRPSALWISRRCRFRMGKREWKLSVGAAGGAELLLITVLLGWLAYEGLHRLCREAALLSERLPEMISALDLWLTGKCHIMEEFFGLRPDCLVRLMQEMLMGLTGKFKEGAMPFLMENSVTILNGTIRILVICVLFFLAAVLSLEEMDDLKRRRDSSQFWREYAMIGERLAAAGRAYAKTQGIILVLTMGVCAAGLWLLGNPYYIMLGVIIGFLDALPVLGAGTVFLPWAVWEGMSGRWGRALGLFMLYLVCYVLRENLEARIMGNEMGLTPLESLTAIYVGWQLFGFFGFILGPIGLLLIEDLVEAAESSWEEREREEDPSG